MRYVLPLLLLPALLSAQQRAIDAFVARPELASANVSIAVRDAATGQLVASHRPDAVLPTASTMKAVTSATALAILGADFRFETVLEHDGQRTGEGVLRGNLYLRGTGDPTLGSDRFEDQPTTEQLMTQWAEKIKAAGVRRIEGDLVGDASAFSTQLTPGHWSWEDMANYYGAGASGLNLYENSYDLYLRPGPRVGAPATVIRTYPEIPGLFITSELTTGSANSGDQAYLFGAPYTYERYVRGSIPAGRNSFKIRGSIPEPDLLAAQLLRDALRRCDIVVSGTATTVRRLMRNPDRTAERRSTLLTHLSPPLSQILEPLNYKSINLYAEALLKAIAVARGRPGSTAEGAGVLQDYWTDRGVSDRGMRVTDGSGLSATNAMSAAQMSMILAKASRDDYFETLLAALPRAGRTGPMRNKLRGTAAEGRVWAKSGTTVGTRSYTGYARMADGSYRSFSLLVNNYDGSGGAIRRRMEQLMLSIASQP